MKRLVFFVITLFFLVHGGQMAQAEVRIWELDKNHSNFYFTVDHIFSKIQGYFKDYSGEIKFDPNNLGESRFYFEIKTASVDTGIAKRDKHLQSTDFFDEGKFPLMTFESTKIKDAGNGVYEVLGNFTIKGETHELLLPLTFMGVKAHPAAKGKDVIGFNGNVIIDRLVYKVGNGKFNDMGVVGKDVGIFVTLEALGDQ